MHAEHDMERGKSSSMKLPRLPGPALAALYLAVCLAPLALAPWAGAAAAGGWERGAAALGMIALAGIAIQFLTSGRFETVSGRLGIDRIMAFHKVSARWVVLAVVLHPPLYVVPTLLDDPALGLERMTAYVMSPRYITGGLAWLAVVFLVVIAVLRKRLPLSYEAWRASHLLLALAAVGLGLVHAVSVGRFSAAGPVFWFWVAAGAAVALALALLYGLRWLHLHTRPWRLASVTPIAKGLWELDIQPCPGTPQLDYEASQFIWMTEGRRRFPLFDHPFSIADSPLRPGLSLIIKEIGDFTGKIGELPPGTLIGIDGPHGDFTLEGRDADAVLLIAGGVGIAPIMGLLRDLATRRDRRPIRLAYAAGTPAKLACLDEIEAAREVLDLQPLILSETPAKDFTGAMGILDRGRLESLLEGLDRNRTVAMICGPDAMVTAVTDTLLDLGLPIEKVVYERFDYASRSSSRPDRARMRVFAAVGAALGLVVVLFALG